MWKFDIWPRLARRERKLRGFLMKCSSPTLKVLAKVPGVLSVSLVFREAIVIHFFQPFFRVRTNLFPPLHTKFTNRTRTKSKGVYFRYFFQGQGRFSFSMRDFSLELTLIELLRRRPWEWDTWHNMWLWNWLGPSAGHLIKMAAMAAVKSSVVWVLILQLFLRNILQVWELEEAERMK